MAFRIYTKTGDGGSTALIGGKRVPKNHIRIESYGTVDELNSYIGLIKDQEIDAATKSMLNEIQDRLFTIGSALATDTENSKMKLPDLKETDIELLEKEIDKMEESLPPMRSFVLPGGHTTISFCHITRCVCRRAERSVIHLSQEGYVAPIIVPYLNRLSDYLFVLSRFLTIQLHANETPWKPRI